MLTVIEDIEKLERLLAELKNTYGTENYRLARDIFCDGAETIILSFIADWKEMRGEIERLTKELDEAYELVAQKVDGLSEYTKYSKDFIADLIRGLKAKEE